MERKNKIMFAGPSGIGKTTLAEKIGNVADLNFISGSVSDLLPKTKEQTHQEMLAKDPKTLYMEDFQVLNLRKKRFQNEESFISDRSFLDVASYFMYKQADKIPECEVKHFMDLCKMFTNQYCSHLILLDFTPELIGNWIVEDNEKRVTNGFFQCEISSIMKAVIKYWNAKFIREVHLVNNHWYRPGTQSKEGVEIWKLDTIYGETRIMIVKEPKLDIRSEYIINFIYDKI